MGGIGKAIEKVAWLFAVDKAAKSFILHFPTGESIDLAPLLP